MRFACLLLALSAVEGLAGCAGVSTAPEFDVVLRGGTVVDGTGAPGARADVAIRGDRIVRVGRVEGRGAREIDASGLVVAPGFIDIHSHSEYHLLEDGRAESKIRQGVTTEVFGEDTSPGPVMGKLKGKAAWSTLGGYFDAVEKSGSSVNVASFVAQGQVWRCVMGDSFERPTPIQLAVMRDLVAEAMDDGALGLSCMLAGTQGMLATTEDLVLLCGPVHGHGGLFSTHIRNEGVDVLQSVREAIDVGRRANVGVDVIHLKIADQQFWGRMKEIVALIEEARREGVNAQSNVYPYTRGNNNLASILPPWAREGGHEKTLARLRDPAERARMKADSKSGVTGWYNHYTAVGGDWSRMLINGNLSAKNRALEGKTMDAVVGKRPTADDRIDAMLDLLLEENGSVPTIFAHHVEEDMTLALRQPWCSVGSDGLAHAVEGPLRRGVPHPRSFGTFPRVLGVYVREKNLLTLEDAVRKMTSLNARKLGLADRGELREGAYADVAVFNPATVLDKATYLDPFQYPQGIPYVIVNGRVVIDGGAHTGAKPGRALRKGR